MVVADDGVPRLWKPELALATATFARTTAMRTRPANSADRKRCPHPGRGPQHPHHHGNEDPTCPTPTLTPQPRAVKLHRHH